MVSTMLLVLYNYIACVPVMAPHTMLLGYWYYGYLECSAHPTVLLYSLVSYLSGVLLRGTGIAWDLRHLLLAGVSTTSNPLLCFACASSTVLMLVRCPAVL